MTDTDKVVVGPKDFTSAETCTATKTFTVQEAEFDVECGKVPHDKSESHVARFTESGTGRVWFIWDEE